MQSYRLRLRPQSAFGSPLKGDTLFGQLCWAIRNRHGKAQLEELLEGYTDNRPFAVLSDAFPAGYLPRPALPADWFDIPKDQDRKEVKKRCWLPMERFAEPVERWVLHACTEAQLTRSEAYSKFSQLRLQPHNSINRLTGTTTGEGFAPYGMLQIWHQHGVELDIYLLLDEGRLHPDRLKAAVTDIGTFGFGRDASIGLGKFSCVEWSAMPLPAQNQATAGLTLAPCAPQGLGLDERRCFYTVFTRFGRHGDLGVHYCGNPFKSPVLLAETGAVLSPLPNDQLYIGQGLGGREQLSKSIPETVHQGYAPVIPIRLPKPMENAL